MSYMKTVEQESKELDTRCVERIRTAAPALDRIDDAWQMAGCPAESAYREEALAIHKSLAKDVMRDVVKTCVRIIVLSALERAVEETT